MLEEVEADEPPPSLIVGGDVMLGGRMRRLIAEHGSDYPFDAVRPLLRRASMALANLEGPLASESKKVERNYSYRVKPALAHALARAGLRVMALANNHLMDCGPGGVVETLAALADAGVLPLGAGANAEAAHQPVVFSDSGGLRIGLIGYYWNRRCAAMPSSPGGAMDVPERLEADVRRLRALVDRVVVTFHWGIPYEPEPLPGDREKARFAIDCGADAVVGHHPHVLQPFELYRGRPIFYSLGNFAFGSGNSKAEGMLVALRFTEESTVVHLYPLYVKNRDPRANYQPKVLRGGSARRVLHRLAESSGPAGKRLELAQHDRGVLRCFSTGDLAAVEAGGARV
jgi:poly-gamma-glutamate capsule biosynthesis protein CapA/YwtB (metallophosphatase superfamily)